MALPDGQNFIRITVEDANSEHVESLLRRQMSLRGERGITSLKKRRWYYSSWFVLMIAAGVMAFSAWAIVEPHFSDTPYLQGPITAINLDQTMDFTYTVNGKAMHLSLPGQGYLQIGNEKIWFYEHSKLWTSGRLLGRGKTTPLVPSDLKIGQEVRAYVELAPGEPDAPQMLAAYIEPNPPHVSASRSAMTIMEVKREQDATEKLLFPLVAGLIAVGVAGADGIICRIPRRALICAGVGLVVGLVGGYVAYHLANIVYNLILSSARKESNGQFHLTPMAFVLQMGGRGLGWLLAGSAMGLGQGIALRSKRLVLYGFLGGIVGGLLGGLVFDPIDMLFYGIDKPTAWQARMFGFTIIGLSVGAMIGIVELLARDAWLRMTEGPLTGKEFLLFKDSMRIGSSSKSDIYLFNDPQVSPMHAIITTIGDTSEIDASKGDAMVLVNTRPTRRTRLRHGDQITIGRTSFLFQTRKG